MKHFREELRKSVDQKIMSIDQGSRKIFTLCDLRNNMTKKHIVIDEYPRRATSITMKTKDAASLLGPHKILAHLTKKKTQQLVPSQVKRKLFIIPTNQTPLADVRSQALLVSALQVQAKAYGTHWVISRIDYTVVRPGNIDNLL
jgi:hypothetical protein